MVNKLLTKPSGRHIGGRVWTSHETNPHRILDGTLSSFKSLFFFDVSPRGNDPI